MAYTTFSAFTLQHKHRVVGTTGDVTSSEFTSLVDKYSAEFNDIMVVTVDICSSSAATAESKKMMALMNDLIEEHLTYIEQGLNVAVQDRVSTRPPSSYDINHAYVKTAILKEKAEEHARVITVNLNDGRVTRY